MRALGIDHGKKRVGVAVTAEGGRLALPLEVVPGKDRHVLLGRIQELAVEHGAETVVVGHPLTMLGSSGQQALQAEDFAARLRHKLGDGVRVVLWDERLTSVQVDRARPGGAQSKDGTRDLMAAVLILQTFLDAQGPR